MWTVVGPWREAAAHAAAAAKKQKGRRGRALHVVDDDSKEEGEAAAHAAAAAAKKQKGRRGRALLKRHVPPVESAAEHLIAEHQHQLEQEARAGGLPYTSPLFCFNPSRFCQ